MAERFKKAFYAYPAEPADLVNTISGASKLASQSGSKLSLKIWPNMSVFGANVPDEVRESIRESDVVVADVTVPNLNVYYEVGFAIGEGKAVAPVVNKSFANATVDPQRDGIFDNIGYKTYENADQLFKLLGDLPSNSLIDLYGKPINFNQPLFLLDALHKTDFISSIVSGIKGAKVFYRSFDPVEIPRFSTITMISEITSSAGVIVPYLAPHVGDADRHNLRAALLAGLSHGLNRSTLIIRMHKHGQSGPADYRDMIEIGQNEKDIFDRVGDFAKAAVIDSHSIRPKTPKRSRSSLQKLTLGSSAAENEFRTLQNYFVETSEFVRTRRGEVNVVAGRKGSGKSAIFFMVRDDFRDSKHTVVVDLKPESHQLSLFRRELASVIDAGVLDHTLAAFWYFVVLSEIALTLRRSLQRKSKFDGNAYAGLREISESLDIFDISETGDFSSRINKLASYVLQEIERAKSQSKKITSDSLTNIVFRNGISSLKNVVVKYTDKRSQVVFLFDNIDKGWPTNGVDKLDVRLVRLLIETLDKVRRDLDTQDREFLSVVFLRNDIYELLMDETPDRGKAAQIRIDWTDRVKLRQVILKRLQDSTRNVDAKFEELWQRFFIEKISGKDSFDYFVEHSLMRPRFLINIIENAVANAINRGHSVVDESDCIDAVRQHSNYLIDDFGFEIRDVSKLPEDLLYALVGAPKLLAKEEIFDRLSNFVKEEDSKDQAFKLMLWYGVLGIINRTNSERYIYDFDYNMKRLEAEIRTISGEILYVTNPALQVALE
ncbi:P-loop ATPase, Sll1717 family [Methylobacterium soli]|uniref:Uncharacterized protein n=1 Tax=Methylobacterium soli TaxID=553447 RepID=A0A6L3SW91_9HYPH|nr:hypothetical protein [Methylobacterium soli]KAB1078058.1 hypothetical protein F6X53_16305 [Methylobacterium soli]GJE42978.1 2'-deoxynucleoside 5'-phosphate N-hydrolase 1 [Methylobacterium soli]